jgi:hypothetical protein
MCLWQDTAERLWEQAMESASYEASEQPARPGPSTTSTEAIDEESAEVEVDTVTGFDKLSTSTLWNDCWPKSD